MELTVDNTSEGGLILRLSGRLDVAGVDAVEAAFLEAAKGATAGVAVDMQEVAFVASLGIRMFVSAARPLHAQGRRLVLFASQPAVADVFELAALDELIKLAPHEEAACAAL